MEERNKISRLHFLSLPPILAHRVYVENNHAEAMPRDMPAEMAKMTKYQFSMAFKKRIGQSLTSHMISIRIKKAAELLYNSHLKIIEIAYLVGYAVSSILNVYLNQYIE